MKLDMTGKVEIRDVAGSKKLEASSDTMTLSVYFDEVDIFPDTIFLRDDGTRVATLEKVTVQGYDTVRLDTGNGGCNLRLALKPRIADEIVENLKQTNL
jgi:hypothetical protein